MQGHGAIDHEKVKIVVGEDYGETTTFTVRQLVLDQKSPWFRAALDPSKGFQEAITKTVKLPNYLPSAFDHCKQWMKHSSINEASAATGTWLELAMAWLLADQLRMDICCNEVVKAIVIRHWSNIQDREANEDPRSWAAGVSNVSADTVRYIYDNTTTDSILRKLFVHLFVDTRALQPMLQDLYDYPDAFSAAVGICFKYMKRNERPKITNFRDVDAHCGTTLTSSGPPIIHYGMKCTSSECRHKNGNMPQNFIHGTMYICAMCTDDIFCHDCADGTGHKKSIEEADDDSDGEMTDGYCAMKDPDRHKITEHWPPMFLQCCNICSHPSCRKRHWLDQSAENQNMSLEHELYTNGPRYYCTQCGNIFCRECGDPFDRCGNNCTVKNLHHLNCEDRYPNCDCHTILKEEESICCDFPCPVVDDEGGDLHHKLVSVVTTGSLYEDLLGKKEHLRRRDAKECLRCKSSDHRVRQCPSEEWLLPPHPPRDN